MAERAFVAERLDRGIRRDAHVYAAVGAGNRGCVAIHGARLAVCVGLVPAVYFSLLHMVFVSSIRYREPAMLAIVVLAAGVLASGRGAVRDSVVGAGSPRERVETGHCSANLFHRRSGGGTWHGSKWLGMKTLK